MTRATQVVIRDILDHWAARTPAATAVDLGDGGWTFADARLNAVRAANILAAQGVRQGDRVLIMLGNGPGWLRAWWGTSFLGAVVVPVNTAARGTALADLVKEADAVLAVTEHPYAERLAEVAPGLPRLDRGALVDGGAEEPPLTRSIEVWDPHAVVYTSGTTGRAKGAVTTFLAAYYQGLHHRHRTGPEDVFLADLPLFHVGGMNTVFLPLSTGARSVLRPRFTASRYLDVVREAGVTMSVLVGSMVNFLAAQPPKPDDADNPLRYVSANPPPPDPQAFMRRYGLEDIVGSFSMTEAPAVLATPPGRTKWTSCGRPHDITEVRLVDEHDMPVPVGEPGELIIRSAVPWVITTEYHGRPEETARAWRNGWFHTGDLMRVDEDGDYYFVDRKKDSLRRRGENISSLEVEREVLSHPAVAEAACVGVPDEHGDQDVMVFVTPSGTADLDPAELVEYLRTRLAYFAVPRYVEVVESMPRTRSNKIEKYVLRTRGTGPATWDRLAAGIEITRED
ncbi:AMP-binding protein [Amycolatopsis thermophila]|uniref:Crotonobetaine/carnitine-CoA ligase n=1 Tax=Amycolatopsis thermophila TaxID=206084 RepID=A0ABU0F5U2_9PSEU|nr:AMP-binding protein [Amycolatopsis thermophila]MDQ0382704.1 crotonobetaine/carnitine-CoA ligase [Amycolatopsis thermophila]